MIHALAGICNNGRENRIRENKDIYTAHLYLRSKCNNKGQGRSKKYQHFISVSLASISRVGIVTMIHVIVLLNITVLKLMPQVVLN